MREQRREIDDPRRLIDSGCLHGRDFVLTQSLAYDFKSAGERRIAESPGTALPALRFDCAGERFFGIGKLGLRLGQSRGERGNRQTRPLHGPPPAWELSADRS